MGNNELRDGFMDYMRKRYPNDSNISSTVSMAFFLERNGTDFGVDFQRVLFEKKIPDTYKQKLEESFEGSKNPRARAQIYERSLRLLLEYLDGNPPTPSYKSGTSKRPQTSYLAAPLPTIPRPTVQSVSEYLEKWTRLPGYVEQEDALNLLFNDTFPHNSSLSEVLIKCSTLNDFYGTNIYNIFPIAKHIVDLNIDSRLMNGDPILVNDISLGHGIMSRSGKELHLFSFATKYCSHHNPLDFPIFDSYVEKLLVHFRNVDRFSAFRNEELRDFLVFKRVVIDFRRAYQLDDFNLKQIDQYLWQFGKDVFPKQYGKIEQNHAPIAPVEQRRIEEAAPIDDLVSRFDNDMRNICQEAGKLGYNPTYFLQMIQSKGGYQAAKQLVHTKNPSSGLTRLWELRRLDLSLEAHVLKDEYASLFTDDERRVCRERLESFGYKP